MSMNTFICIEPGYSRSACRSWSFERRHMSIAFFVKTSIRVSTDTIFRWSIVKRVLKQYQTEEQDPITVYDDGWLPVYR